MTLKPTKGEHKTLRQIQAQGSLDPEGGMELGPGTEDGVRLPEDLQKPPFWVG